MAGRHASGTHKPAEIKPLFPDHANSNLDSLGNYPGRKGSHKDFIADYLCKYVFHFCVAGAGMTSILNLAGKVDLPFLITKPRLPSVASEVFTLTFSFISLPTRRTCFFSSRIAFFNSCTELNLALRLSFSAMVCARR